MSHIGTIAGMRLSAALLACVALLSGAEAPSQGTVPGYALYPGDLVKVEVFDHPDLTTVFRVPASGAVPFPLIGQIEHPAGKAVEAVVAELRQRLQDGFLRRADVTVAVQDYGQRVVYVTGSLRRPGAVVVNPFVPLTALQAISQCEGFGDDADRSAAVVIRSDESGRAQVLALRLGERGANEVSDVVLRPQDVVLVPRFDRVHVIGQVIRPGAVSLPTDAPLTVSRAVSAAGGFDRYAREGAVSLVRPGEEVRSVDVAGILAGKPGIEDPLLRPGDTVFVPISRF